MIHQICLLLLILIQQCCKAVPCQPRLVHPTDMATGICPTCCYSMLMQLSCRCAALRALQSGFEATGIVVRSPRLCTTESRAGGGLLQVHLEGQWRCWAA